MLILIQEVHNLIVLDNVIYFLFLTCSITQRWLFMLQVDLKCQQHENSFGGKASIGSLLWEWRQPHGGASVFYHSWCVHFG